MRSGRWHICDAVPWPPQRRLSCWLRSRPGAARSPPARARPARRSGSTRWAMPRGARSWPTRCSRIESPVSPSLSATAGESCSAAGQPGTPAAGTPGTRPSTRSVSPPCGGPAATGSRSTRPAPSRSRPYSGSPGRAASTVGWSATLSATSPPSATAAMSCTRSWTGSRPTSPTGMHTSTRLPGTTATTTCSAGCAGSAARRTWPAAGSTRAADTRSSPTPPATRMRSCCWPRATSPAGTGRSARRQISA